MIQILNPIYDSSFKFLMEDERVARVLLSALLKRKVLRLEQQAQERTAELRDRAADKELGLYRMDYVAAVETEVGGEETVSIEMQKAWMETEVARFRRYLGVRYSDPDNVDPSDGSPRHIVTIYILGHNIRETTEAIAYAYGGNLVDYDGNPASPGDGRTGRGDGKFVSSLTHDTIIVQVKRLPEKPRNIAERLLSVFDQRTKSRRDRHILNYDDDMGGEEVKPLVRRLSSALVDEKLLDRMELEEEMQTEIELKNAAIDKMEAKLAKAGEQLNETKGQLNEAKGQLNETKGQLNETKGQLNEAKGQLNEAKGQLIQKDELLKQKDTELMSVRQATATALLSAGLSTDSIATTLGLTADEVEKLIGTNGKCDGARPKTVD